MHIVDYNTDLIWADPKDFSIIFTVQSHQIITRIPLVIREINYVTTTVEQQHLCDIIFRDTIDDSSWSSSNSVQKCFIANHHVLNKALYIFFMNRNQDQYLEIAWYSRSIFRDNMILPSLTSCRLGWCHQGTTYISTTIDLYRTYQTTVKSNKIFEELWMIKFWTEWPHSI